MRTRVQSLEPIESLTWWHAYINAELGGEADPWGSLAGQDEILLQKISGDTWRTPPEVDLPPPTYIHSHMHASTQTHMHTHSYNQLSSPYQEMVLVLGSSAHHLGRTQYEHVCSGTSALVHSSVLRPHTNCESVAGTTAKIKEKTQKNSSQVGPRRVFY